MVCHSKARLLAVQKARITRARNQRIKALKKAFLYILATLLVGLTFSQLNTYHRISNTKYMFPSKTNFYVKQRIIGHAIQELAKEMMEKEVSKIQNNTIISIDAAWDHRRNGQFCVIDSIDTKTNKIINIEIISKKSILEKFENASNLMEREGVNRTIQKLKNNTKIIGYVHDKDSKTTKLFKQFWGIKEYIDANHARKAFTRTYLKAQQGKYKNIPKGTLRGLQSKLLKFQNILTKSNLTTSERKQQWLNAAQHFQKNHSGCMHAQYKSVDEENKALGQWSRSLNQTKITALDNFLNKTLKYIEKTNTSFRTQANEAFHSLKSHMVTKDKQWNTSYSTRIALAVLRWNYPNNFISMIAKKLQIPQSSGEFKEIEKSINFNRKYYRDRYVNNKKTINEKRKLHRKSSQSDYTEKSGYKFSESQPY